MPGILSSVLGIGGKLIDKLFPDPAERDKAKLELAKLAQEGELKELEVSMSAILAEAQSKDPWTSRARPSFMYVFYVVILSLVIVAPLVGVFAPSQMQAFLANVGLGFAAIPEQMWWTFTAGYLGYGAYRSYDKGKLLNGNGK